MHSLEWHRGGDSKKYTKRMIHKETVQSIRYSCLRRVNIKFLYNSKFDLTIQCLITNCVVITRVLCIYCSLSAQGSDQDLMVLFSVFILIWTIECDKNVMCCGTSFLFEKVSTCMNQTLDCYISRPGLTYFVQSILGCCTGGTLGLFWSGSVVVLVWLSCSTGVATVLICCISGVTGFLFVCAGPRSAIGRAPDS